MSENQSPETNTHKTTFNRRTFFQAAAATALSPKPENQPVQKEIVELEKWQSDVRQSLTTLLRPLSQEEKNSTVGNAHELIRLAWPYLTSNDVVGTEFQKPTGRSDFGYKLYIQGPIKGKDMGDGVQEDLKQRTYEVFLYTSAEDPQKNALIIRTSLAPQEVNKSTEQKQFIPESYPFDFKIQFFPTGEMATQTTDGKENYIEFEDTKEQIEMMTQDLYKGTIINLPAPTEPKFKLSEV